MPTNLEEEVLNIGGDVLDGALSGAVLSVHRIDGLFDDVFEVGSGTVVADGLPDYTWDVEEAALETEHKWHPLIIH